jgi:hypothetical protein
MAILLIHDDRFFKFAAKILHLMKPYDNMESATGQGRWGAVFFYILKEHHFCDFPYFCTRFSASVSVAES